LPRRTSAGSVAPETAGAQEVESGIEDRAQEIGGWSSTFGHETHLLGARELTGIAFTHPYRISPAGSDLRLKRAGEAASSLLLRSSDRNKRPVDWTHQMRTLSHWFLATCKTCSQPFRKLVSSWGHKKEGAVLLHRNQQVFLAAREDLTPEQQQERTRIAACLPV